MSKPADCVIGMGANLGARLQSMRQGAAQIASFCEVSAISALYETFPVGPSQPLFLNAALRVRCALEPEVLLARLLAIELVLGRIRTVRWGPRTLDLDILWIRDCSHRSASLVVPHPHLPERCFAILPLLDVAPTAVDPMTGLGYAELLSRLDCSGVARVEGPSWAGL
ncbi:MAG TPA: 2-amino-4-hydroxy-6-hydroxymethyldihydropteridine diphosphokinase [Polyangiaceae bacterium]|nr:2-amino-4-hydroxy-6-hydroxymethyldihydropteridine diphosphokinase [Polyangiaceae bacterium]